jgi:hypothetical protein
MSNRYKGGIISATPPTTTKASASGAWTLAQQLQAQGADNWPYAGPTYIEDVFSTWLYTGNGATQTITNGVDLSTYGGMVWIKSRTFASGNALFDTARGSPYFLQSNTTTAQTNGINEFGSFTSTGFTVPYNTVYGNTNYLTYTYASWTFRKQPKFFDVLTYTGNGTSGRQISHALASTPGCIIIKCTSQSGTPAGWIVPSDWWVYHRGLASPSNFSLRLNTTAAQSNTGGLVADTSTFTVYGDTAGSNMPNNVNGETYVAYIFAHDAGGFGLNGTDNVISCGSFTNDAGGNADITLGYEPQWLLIKNTGTAQNWYLVDVMRGLVNGTGNNDYTLSPNTTGVDALDGIGHPTATGFAIRGIAASATYIYIAIRRGPMKVPTTGTSVFSPVARTGTGAVASITSGFPVDLEISKTRPIANPSAWFDRLRGANLWLRSSGTGTETETTGTGTLTGWDSNTGVTVGADAADGIINFGSRTYANWMFRRAPGFFDTVCYTGNSTAGRTVSHSLGAIPEMMILRDRNIGGNNWNVYHKDLGNNIKIFLNLNEGSSNGGGFLNSTSPTSSVFTLGSGYPNETGTFVAYLFATCAGVSKVGSYTGNGSSQTINCGFTGGTRFVLIKRTDTTGDWYVWDTARGIIAGNDPHMSLNTTAADVTTNDTIDPDNTGFIVNQLAATNVNVTSATYIFLAIA